MTICRFCSLSVFYLLFWQLFLLFRRLVIVVIVVSYCFLVQCIYLQVVA